MSKEIILNTELYSSKNSRQFARLKNGRTFLFKSKQATSQEKVLHNLLADKKETWNEMCKDKHFPLKVGFYIYRKTYRKWDWQNIIQGLADALVKEEFIPDDSVDYFTPVYLGYEVDKDNPRVIITIL